MVWEHGAQLLQNPVKPGGLLRLQGPVPLDGWWMDRGLGQRRATGLGLHVGPVLVRSRVSGGWQVSVAGLWHLTER